MPKSSNQKEIDVWVQDQSTPPFHRYFMTEDKTDITLTSPITKDDTVINVSSGHGFTTNDHMLINYGSYFQQSMVTNVATDAITIETPVGINIPITGTQIIRGSIEMNVDGSTTPVTYYCRIGAYSDPIDIQHLQVFMRDGSDGDYSSYGGISGGLTNGSFVRFTDTVDQNLGNYKNNGEYIQFGAEANFNTKAPAGEYSVDLAFNLKETYGVVFRLVDNTYALTFTVQDDLTPLIEHRVVATGQVTLGE